MISSVFDDASLTDIVTSRGGLGQHLAAAQVFIDTSTVSPAVSGSISMKLAESGCAYLRVPISGSVTMAETGSLTAMISGPRKRPLVWIRSSLHLPANVFISDLPNKPGT